MSQKLLQSGEKAKSLITIGNFFKALGLIAFIVWGIFRIVVYAGADVYKSVAPEVQKAGQELKNFAPGGPGFSIRFGEKEITLWESKPPGPDWTQLTGQTGIPAGGSRVEAGNGETAPAVNEISVEPPPEGTPEEDLQAKYDKLKIQFIALVGGADQPDYTTLEPTDVAPARQVLANLKVLGVNVAEPAQWETQLEKQVITRYEQCFTSQSLTCVRDWNGLQTRIVEEPPGLREWIKSTLTQADAMERLNDLMNSATNTSAARMVKTEMENAYSIAFNERRQKACEAIGAGHITALELEWCLLGFVVTIEVDEGYQIWSEIGGNKGKLNEDDVITLVWTASSGQQSRIQVPYDVAIAAIPEMDINTTSYTFPETPMLWNTETNPWEPGKAIP